METKRAIAYITVIMLVFVLMAGLVVVRADTPMVSILPDTDLKKGETVTVRGLYFPANTTARIDLLLPDSTIVEGISTGNVNKNGTFTTSFICPDKNGDGYVRVMDGSILVSVLVTIHGTIAPYQQLQVSLNPNMILEGQISHITVLATFLENQNYVVDFLAVNPLSQDSLCYYVLHKGKLEFDYKFTMEGYYWLNISVEQTPYYYTQYLEIKHNPNPDGGGGGGETDYNVTFEVTQTGNVFEIMLWKDTVGYITYGNITVRSPEAKTTNYQIKNSVATVTASSMGTYTVKYVSSGKQFSTTFEYRVTISFTSSSFDDTGTSYLRLLVDGDAPEGNIEVNVTGAVDDVTSIDDGEGSYTTTVVGDYQFHVNYLGISKTTKETYEDTYEIVSLDASLDGDTIVVIGAVLGTKTQAAGSNIQVQISALSQGDFKQTISTSNDGSFEIYIPVVNKGNVPMGMDVQIKANIYGLGIVPTYKTTTVHVSHDILAEYGIWIILLALLIFLLLWYYGYLNKLTRGKLFHPPKSKMGGAGKVASVDRAMGF